MSRLSIEIPEALHRAIKAKASLRGLSLRDYVLRRLNAPELSDEVGPSRRFSGTGLAGLWADREDMADPEAWVRAQRQVRRLPDAD